MQINKLSLTNFKNYTEVSIVFHPKLNCFVGNNGVGKTNLLDAIYYLCMCKSCFSSTDQYSIRNSEEFMLLQAEFLRNQKSESLSCGLHREKKKQFRRNKKEYSRLSDHIGLFPVVMVSPADSHLILGGSEERRKYMNGVISQYNKQYLDDTIRYNKVLLNRNRILKETRNKPEQEELLDVFDAQLAELGNRIFLVRKDFIKKFIPVFKRLYNFISQENEKVELAYQSQMNDGDYAELLKMNRRRDLILQYSATGIHKDDLILLLNDAPVKKTGSQGQQKTYMVSMKLAQFEFLKGIKKIPPLLLLDDVFDKFDALRVRQILKLVADESYGQIFITHTNLDRMNNILKELAIDHKLYFIGPNENVREIDEKEL
jgi:DNA replication and repair protein RecF